MWRGNFAVSLCGKASLRSPKQSYQVLQGRLKKIKRHTADENSTCWKLHCNRRWFVAKIYRPESNVDLPGINSKHLQKEKMRLSQNKKSPSLSRPQIRLWRWSTEYNMTERKDELLHEQIEVSDNSSRLLSKSWNPPPKKTPIQTQRGFLWQHFENRNKVELSNHVITPKVIENLHNRTKIDLDHPLLRISAGKTLRLSMACVILTDFMGINQREKKPIRLFTGPNGSKTEKTGNGFFPKIFWRKKTVENPMRHH